MLAVDAQTQLLTTLKKGTRFAATGYQHAARDCVPGARRCLTTKLPEKTANLDAVTLCQGIDHGIENRVDNHFRRAE